LRVSAHAWRRFASGCTSSAGQPPQIEEARLSNGVRVLLVERHELPIVAVRVAAAEGGGIAIETRGDGGASAAASGGGATTPGPGPQLEDAAPTSAQARAPSERHLTSWSRMALVRLTAAAKVAARVSR